MGSSLLVSHSVLTPSALAIFCAVSRVQALPDRIPETVARDNVDDSTNSLTVMSLAAIVPANFAELMRIFKISHLRMDILF